MKRILIVLLMVTGLFAERVVLIYDIAEDGMVKLVSKSATDEQLMQIVIQNWMVINDTKLGKDK